MSPEDWEHGVMLEAEIRPFAPEHTVDEELQGGCSAGRDEGDE